MIAFSLWPHAGFYFTLNGQTYGVFATYADAAAALKDLAP